MLGSRWDLRSLYVAKLAHLVWMLRDSDFPDYGWWYIADLVGRIMLKECDTGTVLPGNVGLVWK